MCGIAGILYKKEKPRVEDIERMVESIVHRGPDSNHYIVKENAAIGHTRLAIIDPETGVQPMCNEDGTIWISINGEIYNYLSLKKELLHAGHVFKTSADIEVVIHAYEQWGYDCVKRFRGMFAFGIFDFRKKELFLARDHFGIKPLVYYQDNDYFAFASEIAAIKKIKNINREINLQAIDYYLWLGYIPAPLTACLQIRKLLPAHYMIVKFNGQCSDPKKYWQLSFHPDTKKSEEDWLEELDCVLKESVTSHLVSDVPFGAFLSGGIDSSLVVGYMSQILDQPVKTFSIGFHETEFNELPWAEKVATRWHTDHTTQIVTPDALNLLPELVKYYGEPFGDSSAIPTYYVSKLAREKVPMVLSGDGGDEAFAGYISYQRWFDLLTNKEKPRTAKQYAYTFLHRIFPDSFPYDGTQLPVLSNWFRYMQYFSSLQRKMLWKNDCLNTVKMNHDFLKKDFALCFNNDAVNKGQFIDYHSYLPYDILTKVDIASMIHGLEVRTPLVDLKVVEFASTIPYNFNLAKDEKGNRQGKMLLKKLLVRNYSPDFVFRKKSGFAIPVESWLQGADIKKEIHERLLGTNSQMNNYFSIPEVQKIVHGKNKNLIWLLLFLEEWLNQNKLI